MSTSQQKGGAGRRTAWASCREGLVSSSSRTAGSWGLCRECGFLSAGAHGKHWEQSSASNCAAGPARGLALGGHGHQSTAMNNATLEDVHVTVPRACDSQTWECPSLGIGLAGVVKSRTWR